MLARLWSWSDALAIGLSILLLPLSALYWIGWKCYLALYAIGIKRAARPHRPVLVVGNFTVGGSGKTPITVWIAKLLAKNGFQVVIGCSGYGSPRSTGASTAPEGQLNPFEWGDEPSEIREALPGVPLIVGRARVKAAQLCHTSFPDAVLIMDDGLQHLPLATDVQIAIDPPGRNRFVLPAGPYREPVSARRASLVVPGQFQVVRQLCVCDPGGQTIPAEIYGGARVQVLCAIGRHWVFVEDVEGLGMQVTNLVALGDHDPLTAGTLFDPFEPELPIVVTQKDWVKLRLRSDLGQWKLWIARLEAHIEPEEEFGAWLLARIVAEAQERPHL